MKHTWVVTKTEMFEVEAESRVGAEMIVEADETKAKKTGYVSYVANLKRIVEV